MKIAHANIVSAFSAASIGTRVTNPAAFAEILAKAVAGFDFSAQRIPGQGFIMLPPEVLAHVSAGVGKRTTNPEDFVARAHRGQVGLYLKRAKAEAVTGCAVVVYTHAAYVADPDVAKDAAEIARVADATHILVAVLAFAGPKAPLSPARFVHNLAGGNKEAAVWTADEIRALAVTIKSYDDEWCVVAD